METVVEDETDNEEGDRVKGDKVVLPIHTLETLVGGWREEKGKPGLVIGLPAIPIMRKVKGSEIDWRVHVDRTLKPTSYPPDARYAVFGQWESEGPEEYDLLEIHRWTHGIQRSGGTIEGHTLFEALRQPEMIRNCLGLRDAEEIRKKGVEIFEGQHFGGRQLFFPRGARIGNFEDTIIPYLEPDHGEVVLRWTTLHCDFGPKCTILQFQDLEKKNEVDK